jgi:hypothetical protein
MMMESMKRKATVIAAFFIAVIILFRFINEISSTTNEPNIKRTLSTSELKAAHDNYNAEHVMSHHITKTESASILPSDTLPDNSTEVAENSEPDYTKFFRLLPKLYVLRNANRPNVNYALPVNADEVHIEYYKKLMDDGDPLAKFLYATRISIPLTGEINEDFKLKGENIDIEYWRKRFEFVHKLYIEAAQSGIAQAPAQLAMSPNHIYVIDKIESISWALIADKMGGRGIHYIKIICRVVEGCTDGMLLEGVDRAMFYIDLYEFQKI